MTDAQRAKALLAHLRGSQALASELLSLGCLSPVVRATWAVNLHELHGLISDAAKALASIEAASAERSRFAAERGRA